SRTTAQGGSKRSKLSSSSMSMIRPSVTLLGHHDVVTRVEWLDDNTLVSSSMDHSLRIWDVESGANIRTLNGNVSIHTLHENRLNGLVVTGHGDRTVRLWDTRTHDSNAGAGAAEVYRIYIGH